MISSGSTAYTMRCSSSMRRDRSPREVVSKDLRFADALALGVTFDVGDQCVDAFEGLAVLGLPVEVVVPPVIGPAELHSSGPNSRSVARPARHCSALSTRRLALAGDRSR